MRSALNRLSLAATALLLPMLSVQHGFAWGHDGHSMINRVATAALPGDVPEFLRSPAAQAAMDFYGPVPDSQWRSYAVPELSAAKSPDHFIDIEWADLSGPLPRKRFAFIQQLQAAQPKYPAIKMTPEGIGRLPYAATEHYEELQAAMYEYRALLAARQDTKPVEAEIVYDAGILGHFVADGSQPLHVSIQYDGWVGPNPNGYTTDRNVHSKFESDFVHDNIKASDFSGLVPKAQVLKDVFPEFLAYLRHSNSLVEETYQLEKTGAFNGSGTPAGKAFVDERLAAAAIELRNMIYTAWVKSADPVPAYHGN